MPRATYIAAALAAIAPGSSIFACAHEHHGENIPEGSVISPDPLDTILWLHIGGMIASFGMHRDQKKLIFLGWAWVIGRLTLAWYL